VVGIIKGKYQIEDIDQQGKGVAIKIVICMSKTEVRDVNVKQNIPVMTSQLRNESILSCLLIGNGFYAQNDIKINFRPH